MQWCSRLTRREAVGLVLTTAAAGLATTAARQRARLEQAVDLLVPVPPVVLDVGGRLHLVHELHITNMRRERVALQRLVVTSQAGAPLTNLQGSNLLESLLRVGVPRDAPDPGAVLPGQRSVAYIWAPVPAVAPTAVTHRLEITVDDLQLPGPLAIEGARTEVASAPVVLEPPLTGGPWIAIYDPHLIGGHRTALYTIGGSARIPGRFAIDWIRAPATPRQANASGAPDYTQNGFGADVLAVAEGTIAAALDDMPDLPDGMTRPAGPLPLEQHSGNHVVLDLGSGRFAVYEHLRHRSVAVRVGQRVRAGEVVGQIGSSGSTSIGAHLHFHVANANATLAADGLPFVLRQYEHHGSYDSLGALLAGEGWSPAGDGRSGRRRQQHPSPVSVISF